MEELQDRVIYSNIAFCDTNIHSVQNENLPETLPWLL